MSGDKGVFWKCAVIDCFINNNNRNNGNWGLLYEEGKYRLAPIYDNGAALSNKLSDKQIYKEIPVCSKCQKEFHISMMELRLE